MISSHSHFTNSATGAGWVICLFLSARICAAQTISPPMNIDESEKDAWTAFHMGSAHFKKEEYELAASAFRKSYLLNPSWKILYNIAQSEAAAKNYGRSLEAFEKFLADGGDDIPEERQLEVIKEIEKLKSKVGEIIIEAPPNCDVLIDGHTRGQTPSIQKIRVSVAREHIVVVKQGDTPLLQQKITLGSGEVRAISIDTVSSISDTESLAPSHGPEQKNPPPRPVHIKRMPSANATDTPTPLSSKGGLKYQKFSKIKFMVPWAFIGVGGAAVIAGGITGITAYSKKQKLLDQCPQKDACPPESQDIIDSGSNLATATAILLPVGTALAAAGVTIFWAGKHKEKVQGGKLGITPVKTVTLTGFVIEGRF